MFVFNFGYKFIIWEKGFGWKSISRERDNIRFFLLEGFVNITYFKNNYVVWVE